MRSQQDFDQRVAENVRRFRKAAGFSQAGLGEALSDELGTSFQQQAILKIEKGERPLRFAEVVALAEVLRVPIVAFLAPPATGTVSTREQQLTNELLEISATYSSKVKALQHAEAAAHSAHAFVERMRAELAELEKTRERVSVELSRLYDGEEE